MTELTREIRLLKWFATATNGYAITFADDGATLITCLRCGCTSHNPNDVRERYCGYCKRFIVP